MPKMIYNGLDEVSAMMGDLSEQTEGILKMAVYDGAHEVFEAVRAEIQALPVSERGSKPPRDITPEQKAGLLSGMYGSTIQTKDGAVYEFISFEGYNNQLSEKYPKGQPNILIARSIESGATYMNKRPFVTKAAKTARPKALAATKNTFEREIAKITK